MTDVLNGRQVRNLHALRNPASLTAVMEAFDRATATPSPDQRNGPCKDDTAALEQRLASVWADVLHLPTVGPDEDFFELGGDSLMAVTLFAAIHERMGIDLPFATVFRASTVGRLLIEIMRPDVGGSNARAISYRDGAERAVFWIHGMFGSVAFLVQLGRQMKGDQSLVAIETGASAAHPLRSVGQIASEYIRLIRAEQAHGPYTLGGYSMGGVIAYEMACQLSAAGELVDTAFLLDPYVHWRQLSIVQKLHCAVRGLRLKMLAAWERPAGQRLSWLRGQVRQRWSRRIQKADPRAPVGSMLASAVVV